MQFVLKSVHISREPNVVGRVRLSSSKVFDYLSYIIKPIFKVYTVVSKVEAELRKFIFVTLSIARAFYAFSILLFRY
jgi:hypothetical protein